MLLYVVVITLANAGLGYAFWTYLQRRSSFLAWRRQQTAQSELAASGPELANSAEPSLADDAVATSDAQLFAASSAVEEQAIESEQTAPVVEGTTSDMTPIASADLAAAPTLLEAMIDALRQDLDQYDKELAEVDHQVQWCSEAPHNDRYQACIQGINDVTGRYLEHQSTAIDRVQEQHGGQAAIAAGGDLLAQAIVAQAAVIDGSRDRVSQYARETDLFIGCRLLLKELMRLAEANRQLKETLDTALSQITGREITPNVFGHAAPPPNTPPGLQLCDVLPNAPAAV